MVQIKASGSGGDEQGVSSRTARLEEHLRERAPSLAGTSSRAGVAGQCQQVLERLGYHRVMGQSAYLRAAVAEYR